MTNNNLQGKDINYLFEKKFTFYGFWDFCRSNKELVCVSFITLLILYGIKFNNPTIGIDTDRHMADWPRYINWISIGRFGLVALQKLWTLSLKKTGTAFFNPYIGVIGGAFFLYFAALLWCYLFDVFSNRKNVTCKCLLDKAYDKGIYILFSVLFISHQTWAEQIYHPCQSAECMLLVMMMPVAIFLMFEGILFKKIVKCVIGFLLLLLGTSVYHSILIIFAAGTFGCFLIFKENSDLPSREYIRLCVMLLAIMFLNVIVWRLLTSVFQNILDVEPADFGFNFISYVKRSFEVVYTSTIGNVPVLRFPIDFLISKVAKTGNEYIDVLHSYCNISMKLMVFIFIFFYLIFKNKKSSLLYIIAAFSLILCINIFIIIGGAPVRAQFGEVFVKAFLPYYVLLHLKNKIKYIVFFAVIVLGWQQTFKISYMNYCDVARYNADVRLASEIFHEIEKARTVSGKDTPIRFYGSYHHDFGDNFLHGERVAYSPFEIGHGIEDTQSGNYADNTNHGVSFMRTLGYNYVPALGETELIRLSNEVAKNMPDFPAEGSVVDLGGIIVVKFSDNLDGYVH